MYPGGANFNNGISVARRSVHAAADTAPTLAHGLPFGPGIVIKGTPTAPRAYTFDTGANYDTAFFGIPLNATFLFYVVNLSVGPNTITMTPAAGVTISGTATVAQNVCRMYEFRKTADATYVVTNVCSWTVAA